MTQKSIFWVYILHCVNDTYYTGYTTDIKKRYHSHLNGTGRCKYTKSFKPVAIAQCWKITGNKSYAMKIVILMSIIFSIAQAITVRMGHLIGAEDISSAKRAGYVGVLLSAAFMAMVAVIFWLYPSWLIAIDIDIHNPSNAILIKEASLLFAVSAMFQIIEATRISFFGALRALKDTNFTLLASIVSFWGIALPIGYLFATYFQLGGAGLWWGMVLGASCSVALLYWRFKSKIHCYMPHSI